MLAWQHLDEWQRHVANLGNAHRANTGRAEMFKPVGEPLRALTTAGYQSLVRWDYTFSYDTGLVRSMRA